MTSKTIATFSITYRQYLNENSECVADLPDFANDPEQLIQLYSHMVLLRTFDTKAIALQRTGKMGTYASTLGQEAIGTAVGDAMEKNDVLIPFYRDYGAQLQRGATMTDILNYWGGDERGSAYTPDNQDFPICVPIASQCLHAAGVATAMKYRNEKRVAVTSIGDGGTSEGDFYESINVAGVWKLPMIIVINNNQWAISVPLNKQTAVQTLAQKAIAAGIHGEQVDGNDVIAVRQAMQEALQRARNGEGPSVIEAMTYRLCDHTTADDATRYRDEKEVKEGWDKEPIARLRTYLENKNYWDATKEEALQKSCADRVTAAVKDYENTEKPQVTDMFDYHYANMPHALLLQRKEALEDANNA